MLDENDMFDDPFFNFELEEVAPENDGALWKKTDRTGAQYLIGYVLIGGVKKEIAVFKNAKKDSIRQPDFIFKWKLAHE